ncbi:uncharacterized protein LOC129240914 [Anastrepha obliqua]|uniref:uncharacterized protein LOC129240914 n=1 Tax=Anastrepha obliqua TaxID=95512 RepID=UPI00240A123A|nr:uncharacterized protein LOC129240914 [Anastrepha obliqua]
MSRYYTSPYSKTTKPYPSQADDYISLEMGGPAKCSTPARLQYNSINITAGGNIFQNRQRGRSSQRIRSGGWTNNPRGVGGNGNQWLQQTPRSNDAAEWQWRGGGPRQWNNRKSFNNKTNNISSYFHPSMLENPWKELMDRRDAIKSSEINLPTSDCQNEEKPCTGNTSATNPEENDTEDMEAEADEDKLKKENL